MNRIGIVLFLLVLGAGSSFAERLPSGNPDSLRRVLAGAEAVDRPAALYALCKAFLYADNDSAYHYATASLQEALHHGDSLFVARGYRAQSILLIERGDSKEALIALERGLGIARYNTLEEGRLELFMLNDLAILYADMVLFDRALETYFEAMDRAEALGNVWGMGVMLNNIGSLYYDLLDFENALIYYERSRRAKEQSGNTQGAEIQLRNVGRCYTKLGYGANALAALKEALKVCAEQNCNSNEQSKIHLTLSEAYLALGSLDAAHRELQRSLDPIRSVSLPRQECFAAYVQARLHLRRRRPADALRTLDQIQKKLDAMDLPIMHLENTELYAAVYDALGNYKKASHYRKAYIATYKSIFKGDLVQKMSRVNADYEERENLAKIAAQLETIRLREEALELRKKQVIYAFIIIAMILLLLLVVFIFIRKQQKANHELQLFNNLIEQKNNNLEEMVRERTEQLRVSNENLEQVNDDLEHFLYRTSHDIRGPLATIKGLCFMALREVKEPLAIEHIQRMETTVDMLGSILTRLQVLNNINRAVLKPVDITLLELIENIWDKASSKGIPEGMTIAYDIEDNLKIKSDESMLTVIFETLIDNTIKFSETARRNPPFVRIKAFRRQDDIVIKVTDNGIGVPENLREFIFELFARASYRANTGGMGLNLCRSAVRRVDGTIQCGVDEAGLTEFILHLCADLKVQDMSKMMKKKKRRL